jgi:hypothetical protein
MTRPVNVTLISLLVLALGACHGGGGKYAKEKQLLNDLIRETKAFTREFDVTRNRIAVGRSMMKYIEEIKRIKPDLWELEKVCPDYLTSDGYTKAPKELQSLVKQLSEVIARMKVVVDGKRPKFRGDKDVLDIFQELKEVLFYY